MSMILITGGSGLLGWSLKKAFPAAHATYCSHPIEGGVKLDISDRQAVASLFARLKPEVTIHTAAVPSMDLCEANKPLADRVNVEGTRNIVEACRLAGSKIVFVSTSYVFPGGVGIGEDSPTSPVNYYGATKFRGERLVKGSGLPYLILRTDQPYGWVEAWQKKNSVVRALELLDQGREVPDVSDWYNTPTLADDFSKAAKHLIGKNKTGIYHVVGPDYLNRVEWSQKVAEIFGKDKSLVKPISGSSLNLQARRMNARLSTRKLASEGIRMLGVEEGLRMMKAEIEQHHPMHHKK